MTAERDSMSLNEVSVPALGVEERSDEAPRAGRARPTPDPEVVAKPKRRQFSAEYRLRILEEADRCTQPGEVGRLLRREGLYSSHLTAWRKARRKGSLRELAAKKRGAKPAERNPLDAKLRALEAQVARLEHVGRITKAGDNGLRAALYQAATVMLSRGAPNWLKAWTLRLATLRGKKRATVALAVCRTLGHRLSMDLSPVVLASG